MKQAEQVHEGMVAVSFATCATLLPLLPPLCDLITVVSSAQHHLAWHKAQSVKPRAASCTKKGYDGRLLAPLHTLHHTCVHCTMPGITQGIFGESADLSTAACCAGKVHEGMMGAATFVHCNTAAALEAAAQAHPGWPLVVTGHSMGGEPCICPPSLLLA